MQKKVQVFVVPVYERNAKLLLHVYIYIYMYSVLPKYNKISTFFLYRGSNCSSQLVEHILLIQIDKLHGIFLWVIQNSIRQAVIQTISNLSVQPQFYCIMIHMNHAYSLPPVRTVISIGHTIRQWTDNFLPLGLFGEGGDRLVWSYLHQYGITR